MIIVIGKLVEDFNVVSTDGRDIGRTPKVEKVMRPEVCVWLLKGEGQDIMKARQYAEKENAMVLTYPETEQDPLGKARKDLNK